MKIIYSTKFLDSISIFMNIGGITLYPFIILKDTYNNTLKRSKKILNHEKIHIEQQKELLIVFFYLWYIIEWFIRLFMKGNAYRNISFEKESYTNEGNLEYLVNRKRYSFLKYL